MLKQATSNALKCVVFHYVVFCFADNAHHSYQYMCITATVNSSTVQYALTSTGKADLGYMAMGFGTQMAGSPMVIMWENSDGTFMLSQRTASGYVMHTVDSNP